MRGEEGIEVQQVQYIVEERRKGGGGNGGREGKNEDG